MYDSLESPQCVGYRKVVVIQSQPFEVKEAKDDDREKEMCSTDIRQMIVEEKEWKQMVPEAVYNYIVENDLTSKVKQMLM